MGQASLPEPAAGGEPFLPRRPPLLVFVIFRLEYQMLSNAVFWALVKFFKKKQEARFISPLKNGLISAAWMRRRNGRGGNRGHFERLAETCFGQPTVEKAMEGFFNKLIKKPRDPARFFL